MVIDQFNHGGAIPRILPSLLGAIPPCCDPFRHSLDTDTAFVGVKCRVASSGRGASGTLHFSALQRGYAGP